MISVNAMGLVSGVAILNAKPVHIFDEAAIKAVKKWTFYQQKIDNKPVPYQLTQSIEFIIDQIIEKN